MKYSAEDLSSIKNVEKKIVEMQDMDIRTQIAKYFNVPWTEIELISARHDIRFKLDKQLLFSADLTKQGKVKNIRAT